jgi:DnaD and phage-associated domain
MKLEYTDDSLLFSNTNIPDIFFTEYLPDMSGDCLKIYLYIFFLSKYEKEIKPLDLSKKLSISLSSIKDILLLLEELELITKKQNGYIINNIQQTELYKLYRPKMTSSIEEANKNTQKHQYRNKAIENINNSFFQGIMSPSWYTQIDLWFNKYQFDEQVMISLFKYCFDKSALHKNYIKAVADAWEKNGIKTYNDLDNYFSKYEKSNLIKKSIAKKLGLSRNLSQYEEAYIEKWNIDFGYSLEIIELALKLTTSKSNFNFDYLDKIISSWNERSLKNTFEIQNFIKETKTKNKNIKELEKQTSYKSHDQRDYGDLDNMGLYLNSKNRKNA